MSEENLKSKKIDRVELLPTSFERLQTWQKQIDESCPEVMITRKDLVNWVISEHKEILSDSDMRKIKDCFFDPVQYLRSLLKKAESAKIHGKTLELPEFAQGSQKPRKIKPSPVTSEDKKPEAPLQTSEA